MPTLLRTLLASLLILAAGVTALGVVTGGFRAFTSETALRLSVHEHPRQTPTVPLQTANGKVIDLDDLQGHWLLVNFIYTHCASYCSVQGMKFARLQRQLAKPIAAGDVILLSISFDPSRDAPQQLVAYQQHSGDNGKGWIAARPTSIEGLQALKQTFGVIVIPDGLGGYLHNAAINVVDPQGQLVAVTDWNTPGKTARAVLRGKWQ